MNRYIVLSALFILPLNTILSVIAGYYVEALAWGVALVFCAENYSLRYLEEIDDKR